MERELEQLTKTYKAGIINEKEFQKGKERVENKLSSVHEQVKKDEEGRKIVKDILGDEPKTEEVKKEEVKKEEMIVEEIEKPKVDKPKKKDPVNQVKKKVKPMVKSKKKDKKDDFDDDYEEDDSTFTKVVIFAGIICILLLLVLVRVFMDNGYVPADKDLTEVNGTVTIDMYLDFGCEYCKDGWQAMLNLKEIYGDNLKIRVKHFPTTLESIEVANAINCAKDQNKHMVYILRLFDNQENLDINSLKNFAWAEGLDVIEFHSCIDDLDYIDKIRTDMKEGYDKGVRSTPTFFIDDEIVVGVRAESYFEEVINEKLGLN